MEWKIFIKALVSAGLVVPISLLKVFPCTALSLASGGGASLVSRVVPSMAEVAEEDDDEEDADNDADDDDDPERELRQSSCQHRFSQLQVTGTLAEAVACVAIIQTCAIVTEFQSQKACLLVLFTISSLFPPEVCLSVTTRAQPQGLHLPST